MFSETGFAFRWGEVGGEEGPEEGFARLLLREGDVQGDGVDGGCLGEGGEEWGGELDGVFGGGEEGVGVSVEGGVCEVGDVVRGVGVVVWEGSGADEMEALGAEVLEEGLGACESTEGEGAEWGWGWEGEGAVEQDGGDAGGEMGCEGCGFRGAEEDEVGAAEGAEGFAEVAGGEEGVLEVGGGEEEEVQGAVEAAVLEAIVQEVDEGGELGAGVAFGEEAGGLAVGGDVDGEAGLGEEEGFVAEAGGGACGVYFFDGLGTAAVASGEDNGRVAVALEELCEGLDDGGLAGSSGGEAADGEDGTGEAFGGGAEDVVEGLGGAVEGDERQEEGALHAGLKLLVGGDVPAASDGGGRGSGGELRGVGEGDGFEGEGDGFGGGSGEV